MNAFHEFFQRAMGGERTVAPYPYQCKFATQATLPHLLRVPTSAGKTATAILGWLYRWQAQPKQTPRRLVYCLPMRVLVEQSEREARRWINNLGLDIPALTAAFLVVSINTGAYMAEIVRGGILSVVDSAGNVVKLLQDREPEVARSIYTTIDLDFQAAVEKALADAIATHPGASYGAIVVLDPRDGAVPAMATYPSYDPQVFNPLRDDGGAAIAALLNDPGQPLLNRATQGAYPSGSTFKLVTFAAALNSGLYTPDTRYTSTGSWSRLGDAYTKYDWLSGGHGTISLRQAIVVSCNTCFYDVGYTIDGADNTLFPRIAKAFGLGQPTGIQGVAEAAGLIPDPEWKLAETGEGWATGDAVNMAIGQGYVQVTPLQMANVIAAIANGGTLYRPTLIDHIGAGGNAPDEKPPSEINGQLPLSADQLAVLQGALWDVTHAGSGTATHRFQNFAVPVAGKTGTAEAPPGLPHAWFVGYAPAEPFTAPDGRYVEAPELAIAVVLEHTGEGSEAAAPLFRRVVEAYYGLEATPFPWE